VLASEQVPLQVSNIIIYLTQRQQTTHKHTKQSIEEPARSRLCICGLKQRENNKKNVKEFTRKSDRERKQEEEVNSVFILFRNSFNEPVQINIYKSIHTHTHARTQQSINVSIKWKTRKIKISALRRSTNMKESFISLCGGHHRWNSLLSVYVK